MKVFTNNLLSNLSLKSLGPTALRYLSSWPIFPFTIFICLFVAWLYLTNTIPVYQSTATLLIKDEIKGVDDTRTLASMDLFASKKILDNEIEVLRSRMVMKNVVKNLLLYAPVYHEGNVYGMSAYVHSPVKIEVKNPDSLVEHNKIYFDYDAEKQKVIIGKRSYPMNDWINSDWGVLRFLPNRRFKPLKGEKKFFFYLVGVKKMVDKYLSDLEVVPVRKSATIISLKLQDEDPRRAEDVLNELIHVYDRVTFNDKTTLAANALSFLENRIRIVVKELDSVETAMQQYRVRNEVVDIGTQGKLFLESAQVNDQKTNDLNVQLAILDQIEKYVEGKAKMLIEHKSGASIQMGQEFSFKINQEEAKLNNAMERLTSVNRQLTDLPDMPSVNKYKNMNIITLVNENRILSKKYNDPQAKATIEKNKTKLIELEKQVTSLAGMEEVLQKKDELIQMKAELEDNIASSSKKINEYKKQTSRENVAGIKAVTAPAMNGLHDALLPQLLKKLDEAEIQYEKYKRTTAENSPILSSLRNQMEKLKPSIIENIRNQKDNLKTVKTNLEGTSETYSSMLRTIPGKERDLLDITRQQSIKNNIYEFLLQKREEAALSLASTVASSRLVDSAETFPYPISPKKSMAYVMALIMGLGMGVVFIHLKEPVNKSILSRTEIEALSSLPILGEILYVGSGKPIIMSDGANTHVAEQLRQIRTSLSFLGINGMKKKLLVTSYNPGEGKSFIASNLAISLALTEKKVVLVELDLRRPKLSKIFNVMSDSGMSDYLMGKAVPEQIIKRTRINNNLELIPAGGLPSNPSELILNGRLEKLLDYLERNFDYIIIETAPIGAVTDAHILSKLCDATLFIIREGLTTGTDIKMLENGMKLRGLNNAAIVYNGVHSNVLANYGYRYSIKTLLKNINSN